MIAGNEMPGANIYIKLASFQAEKLSHRFNFSKGYATRSTTSITRWSTWFLVFLFVTGNCL